MQLLLVRHAYLPAVTLGSLHAAGLTFATLEEPWTKSPFGPGGQRHDALNRGSCVQEGTYALEPHNTTTHPHVWALVNPILGVWHEAPPPGLPYGRSAVLIHSGNTIFDTEGCVLVGMRHGRIDPLDAVIDSRTALAQLQTLLGSASTHQLIIRPTAGTSEIYEYLGS